MKKALVSFIILVMQMLFLPACSKSNIEQITGTATSTTEQTKEATQIVEEGKKEKEDTYLSKIKSCWGWTCQNKKYIAGGAVVIGVLGLVVWRATKGEPAPKAKTDTENFNQPYTDNDLPGGNPAVEKQQTSQGMDAYGHTTINDYSSSDEDIFQATEVEMQSLSHEPPMLQVHGHKSPTHTAYGLTEDSERFINYKFSKTKAQNPKPDDKIYLNGQKSKGLYMFADNGHWYNIVFNGHTPKPLKPVVK